MFFRSRNQIDSMVAKQVVSSCEAMMEELGAEIHDDLIQRLTVIRLSLDKLEKNLSSKSDSEALLRNIRTEFSEITESIRKTSRILLPVSIDEFSFQHSVEMMCQNIIVPTTGEVHFDGRGAETKLDTHTSMYLYRVIQELVHNAFKHSSAWHVWVRMIWNSKTLVIEVEDDGSGFSKIHEFVDRLKSKRNTLKMRTTFLKAKLEYLSGARGLLARVTYCLKN